MSSIPADLIADRLDKNERAVTALEDCVQSIEATVNRIEAKLETLATRADISALPTKDSFRNWNLTMIAAIATTFPAMIGLFLPSAGNQLSAFSAGLSALQTTNSGTPPPR